MTIILSISLILSLAWGFWQRARARSAEDIMYKANDVIECQNILINKLKAKTNDHTH